MIVLHLHAIATCYNTVNGDKLRMYLANGLLFGLHNFEKDHDENGVLLQTSVKRDRLSD